MNEEYFFTNFGKRNSLQPLNYYEDPSLASQLFIPKPSRPSIDMPQDLNITFSRNLTYNSPRSSDWSEPFTAKKRVRPSDLPYLHAGTIPQFDKTDHFSQLWVNPTSLPSDNIIFNVGTIINQNTATPNVDTMFFIPYSSLGDKISTNSQNSIQAVFLGPPYLKNSSLTSLHKNQVSSLKNIEDAEIKNISFKDDNLNLQWGIETIILKIFFREKIDEHDLRLNHRDFSILNSLLQRKFMKAVDLESYKTDVNKMINIIENLINFSSNKRPEECHKFILSKAFKYLRKTFKPSEQNETESTAEFYEYYFSSAVKRLDLKISDFYFPSKSKSIKNPNSLNGEYFAKLFASDIFVVDLRNYMKNNLILEHKFEIKKKISKMLSRWDEVFKLNPGELERNLAIVKCEIVKNKKFKLPWTFSELSEAIFRINELIDSFNRK